MYPRKSTSSAKGATKHPTPTLSTDIFALIEEVTANARSMGNAATKENAAAGLMGARNPSSASALLSLLACAATMAETDIMTWKRFTTPTQIQPCRMRRRPVSFIKSLIYVQITNPAQAISADEVADR